MWLLFFGRQVTMCEPCMNDLQTVHDSLKYSVLGCDHGKIDIIILLSSVDCFLRNIFQRVRQFNLITIKILKRKKIQLNFFGYHVRLMSIFKLNIHGEILTSLVMKILYTSTLFSSIMETREGIDVIEDVIQLHACLTIK